jgi:CRISPR-associated protein Cas5d
MQNNKSPTLSLRAKGRLACFTRPELKVERVSYEIMTPSAARGLFEAVLWKPAIVWHIERIKILNEIRFVSFRRNEVNNRAGNPSKTIIQDGGDIRHYFADEDRAQRNTVALFDVDYIIEAHFVMTDKAGPEDNMNKFIDMFTRRVQKGQHFHQPYLGCREFPAQIMAAEDAPAPIPDTKELGLMLWDIDYSGKKNRPIFFSARLENGVLEVPEDPLTTLNNSNGGGVS